MFISDQYEMNINPYPILPATWIYFLVSKRHVKSMSKLIIESTSGSAISKLPDQLVSKIRNADRIGFTPTVRMNLIRNLKIKKRGKAKNQWEKGEKIGDGFPSVPTTGGTAMVSCWELTSFVRTQSRGSNGTTSPPHDQNVCRWILTGRVFVFGFSLSVGPPAPVNLEPDGRASRKLPRYFGSC